MSEWRGSPALREMLVPIDRLVPFERNPRVGDVTAVAASLERFGQLKPVVVDGDRIVAGHHVVQAARERLGWEQIAVAANDFGGEDEQRAFLLADNRTSELGFTDQTLLAEHLQLLAEQDLLDGTGYDGDDLDDLLADLQRQTDGDRDADAVPSLPAEPSSRRGEVYELGRHRLMCGDATNTEHVAQLLNGSEPLVMLTDPPYGVLLDGEWRDRAGVNTKGAAQKNYMEMDGKSVDLKADWSDAFELVPSLSVVYVWHASSHTCEVAAGLRRIGFEHFQQIIWDKGIATRTRTHYWYQHEPCWYARKARAPWRGAGGTENATVWAAVSPKFIMGRADEDPVEHPTQKPLSLYVKPIENHTERGDLIYDPFVGSGTTLIAAEQLGRTCFAMEIDPVYCDVIRQRYADFTGQPEHAPTA